MFTRFLRLSSSFFAALSVAAFVVAFLACGNPSLANPPIEPACTGCELTTDLGGPCAGGDNCSNPNNPYCHGGCFCQLYCNGVWFAQCCQ